VLDARASAHTISEQAELLMARRWLHTRAGILLIAFA
jgi:hypothetical protein